MGKVIIIGAGGVGNVVTRKCARDRKHFDEIILASRTIEKARKIADKCEGKVRVIQIDAMNVKEMVRLFKKEKPDIVINVALPYHDLPIMDACYEAEVNYLDTANYEPPDKAEYAYKWQWDYNDKFLKKNIMGILGCGFDPGVTNIFCSYAMKCLLDEIWYIDIVDCNGGDHGYPFATNFNVEINLREITQNGKYWEKEWKITKPLEIYREFDFPGIGKRKMYLIMHEELESIVKFFPGLKRIRFWMTFSDNYLKHLEVLQNIGMTSIKPVDYEGHPVVPIKFLQKLLPDPASLAPRYKGKVCIGCLIEGIKNGKNKRYFIYSVCDHQECYKDVEAQAVSYTAGVPPVVGAVLVIDGIWKGKGVFNVEQFDPEPFLKLMPEYGISWQIEERNPTDGEIEK